MAEGTAGEEKARNILKKYLDRNNVPMWISDDDNEGDAELESAEPPSALQASALFSSRDEQCQSVETLPKLDGMPLDISASILHSLSVQEIATVSKVNKALYRASRNPDLWKLKFCSRWNFSTPHHGFDWFLSYIEAYQNTSDLWVTHWNCVEPTDSLAPGRCCIRKKCSDRKKGDSNVFGFQELCPTCRYEDMETATKQPSVIKTKAQAVAAATALRLRNHSELLLPEYSPSRARKAFAQSSTLHRELSTQQYNANSLSFLSDLLFFQVHDGPQELEEQKGIFETSEQISHDGSDTGLHSWHVAHFSNPDFHRPLIWKVSVQRGDCFTVYPSEGYLKPGATQHVVFGVKPLASLLAHATQQLDAHREGVDEFWANVYEKEAHLPVAPFQIHYQHALVIPCRGAKDDHKFRYYHRSRLMQIHQTQLQRMGSQRTTNHLMSPWEFGCHRDHPVRSLRLSAHVNANFSLSEFRRSTLNPFEIRACDRRKLLVYCAPQIMLLHPSVGAQLENIDLELEDSIRARAYRTEPPCRRCGCSWGERLEELAQAYIVAKIECGLDKEKRDRSLERTRLVLMTLLQHDQDDILLERHLAVSFALQKTVATYRGAAWLSSRQQQVLVQWEALIDLMCRVRNKEASARERDGVLSPWRHAGLYSNSVCSDSAFLSKQITPIDGVDFMWKEEPHYLKPFAHLVHNGGNFCLGPQEDPNHLWLQDNGRYRRRQKGFATDMFMDDPICGLQSALCVLYDPRSLLLHGIFDAVRYPGTIVRRPKLPRLPLLDGKTNRFDVSLASFFETPEKLVYYEAQNSLDLDCLLFIDSMSEQQIEKKSFIHPISLRYYLQNIPPPGAGRFPLCTGAETGQSDAPTIHELRLNVGDAAEFSSATGISDGDQVDDQPLIGGNHVIGVGGDNNVAPRPRIVRFLRAMSAYMGLTVADNHGATCVYGDRRILISAQWLSISLMTAPLMWTLIARFAMWVPTTPVDYKLQGLPYIIETEMRFLTEKECGYVALALFFLWLFLGRCVERYTSRDFLRAMLEDVSVSNDLRYIRWCQRTWDVLCPLFIQRMVFVPHWNLRSNSDLMKHAAFWRSQHYTERRSTFLAANGRGPMWPESGMFLGKKAKILIGLVVAGGSFCLSSPHFSLNLLTVFMGSISFGASMSLESMEITRADVTSRSTGPMTRPLGMVTMVSISCLVGQLVGSSGGVLFLVDFIMESFFLAMGGTVTISTGATESWMTFCCLSLAAFWGYLLGRMAVLDGMRKKKRVKLSVVLCICIVSVVCLWLLAVFCSEWDFPVSLVILRPTVGKGEDRKFSSRQLQ